MTNLSLQNSMSLEVAGLPGFLTPKDSLFVRIWAPLLGVLWLCLHVSVFQDCGLSAP